VVNINLISPFAPPTSNEVTLHLCISESPPHKDHLCQDWFQLVEQFCRRRLKSEKMNDYRQQMDAT